MNRAAKRHQKKLARKATKARRAVVSNPSGQNLGGAPAGYLPELFRKAAGLHKAGEMRQAETIYRQILGIDPDHADTNHLLGLLLYEAGNHADGVESISRAIAKAPGRPVYHCNLGAAFQGLGRAEEAAASFYRALAIKPDYTEAHSKLGVVLQELGNLKDALKCHRHAVALDPRNDKIWAGFASLVESVSFTSVDDSLLQDLLHLLERPTVRPYFVVQPIISALCLLPDFSHVLEQTGRAAPEIEISYAEAARLLSAIPLFLRLMALNPIHDPKIEQMLMVLRRAMIEETQTGNTDDRGLPFSAALALQCFSNEYIYSETAAEKAAVEQLEQRIAAFIENGDEVPHSVVAALGAYRPLHGFPWARTLSERNWAGGINDVIGRQILEPLEERSLRAGIPRLTAIEDTVSQSVRDQYEENPFPRWIKTGVGNNPRPIGDVLSGPPLRLDLGDYVSPENPEILVAGCGTGQHALSLASRFSNARVLAVDLSLTSLSYAVRKTNELGFANVEYAQADIMELGGIGRQFDFIESVGVLHHLGDPLAGWRILVDLLKPGGIIKIGLYSETARRDIVSGRRMIAEAGYTASHQDIRRCRADIMAMAGDGNPEMAKICNRIDFFSLSNCRDLLFHVQEHCFTVPQIEDALASLDLSFLGFGVQDINLLRKFRESHPGSHALTSLPLWHEFELENPDTFKGMYQFWCRRRA